MQDRLCETLRQRYESHWFAHKGSAYRCIRSAGCERFDPVLRKVAQETGVTLPPSLSCITLWIDPNEVSVRIGDAGSIYNLPLHKLPSANAARGAQPELSAAAQ